MTKTRAKTVKWEVRLTDNDLLWRPTPQTPIWRNFKVGELEALVEFRDLGRKFGVEQALSFAQKWGPLGICCHDRFYSHGAEHGWGLESNASLRPDAPKGRRIALTGALSQWADLPKICVPRRIRLKRRVWFAEPLVAWEELSRAVDALITVKGNIGIGAPPPEPETQFLNEISFGFGRFRAHYAALMGDEAESDLSQGGAGALIEQMINDWLSGAPVRHYCHIDRKTMKVTVDQIVDDRFGVFPVIAVELFHSIADPDKIAMCNGCLLPFLLVRERGGDRVFCRDCIQSGVRSRMTSKDARARKKE